MKCKRCGCREIGFDVAGVEYRSYDENGDIIDVDYDSVSHGEPFCADCGCEDVESDD